MQRIVKRTTLSAIILLSTTLLVACSGAPSKPGWVDDPDSDQAVGHCGPHALGKQKQQECAETRARIELAKRQGVTLKSISVMQETAGTQGSSSQLDQKTIQEVNAKVKAKVVEKFYDPYRDELYVLIEED